MRRLLALVLFAAACDGAGPHAGWTEGAPATLAAVETGGALLVAAMTEAGAGGELVVDTGAPLTMLAPGRFAGVGAGYGEVSSLRLGDAVTIAGTPILGLDLFAARPAPAPAGLLGGATLCRFVVGLDFRAREVRLGRVFGEVAAPADALAAAELPFSLAGGGEGTSAGRRYTWPATRVRVDAAIEGVAATLILDSGATWTVLRRARFDALLAAGDGRAVLGPVPVLSTSGRIDGRLTRARGISVAGQVGEAVAEGDPVFEIGDALLDGIAAEVGFPVDGLLGASFLRAFHVTIDYPGGRLRLARLPGDGAVDGDEFHQVGVALDASPPGSAHRFMVAAVYAGSDAARVGLREGDLVASIDGVGLDGLGFEAARLALRGPIGAARTMATARRTFVVRVEDLLPPLVGEN